MKSDQSFKLFMRHILRGRITLHFLLALCLFTQPIQADNPPDFTRGDKITGKTRWALGPTGAHGVIWAKSFDTQGTKQVYVTDIDAGSPADGKLQKDDIVLGVVSPRPKFEGSNQSGPMFANDARKELALAITEAEKPENSGKLVLKIWRDGKTLEAELHLQAMGSFSKTAPVGCPKTEKMIQLACNQLEENGISRGIAGHFVRDGK